MGDKVKLEDRLRCFGYFGFGGGYEMAMGGNRPGREVYCNRACGEREKCWRRHKDRVREILPGITELADQVAADGFVGPAYIFELTRRLGESQGQALDTTKPIEPYVLLMSGNIEDGILCGEGHGPKDRGPVTLAWPLHPLRVS